MRPATGLLCSRCSHCGHVAYPTESICSACGRRDDYQSFELGPDGTLYTFTIVHVAAPGTETPYALGYVDFAEGARVFGRIVPEDHLAVGMMVRVVPVPGGGRDHFWFEPVGEGGGDP